MRNLKLVLEYEGSAFFGFQKQPKHPTIQDALEKALSKLLGRKTKIRAASGRTDAGVHAEHQVVNFLTDSPFSVRQLQKGLNALLPKQVAVKEVREVPSDFHARYSARWKTYEYRIWNHPVRSPLQAFRSHHVPYVLDLKKIRAAAKVLTGKHDFRAFCASAAGRVHTVRTLRHFEISREGSLIRIRIEADGFLYHMVRNLVGTLLELGRERMTLKELREVLAGRDRRKAGATAPARGLALVRVTY